MTSKLKAALFLLGAAGSLAVFGVGLIGLWRSFGRSDIPASSGQLVLPNEQIPPADEPPPAEASQSWWKPRRIPVSKKPGPPHGSEQQEFVLDESNSSLMKGVSEWGVQRWCDIAGNFYSTRLIREFSYVNPGSNGPSVRVRVAPEGPTLKGRLEARGLKPNFAYQIKLRGLPDDDFEAFERIGYIGRWRLPGRGTNYTDNDYRAYPDKQKVEAYILFDFFVTDGRGNAIRDFELDSSLHVLWNGSRQAGTPDADDLIPVLVEANDPEKYAVPRRKLSVEFIWAERELCRYTSASDVIRLPPGKYRAELVLTEESFHSPYNDGGYWATVLSCPVEFTITADDKAQVGVAVADADDDTRSGKHQASTR